MPADHAGGPSRHMVTLSGPEMVRLGLQTAQAISTQFTPRIHGYGVVVNGGAIAQADADVETAAAAMHASDASLKRAQALYGHDATAHAVSQEALEAAEREARTAEAQFALADGKEVAAFGSGAPWRGPLRDQDLLHELTSGRALLVEATFPLDVTIDGAVATLSVTRLNASADAKSWTASRVWEAPADPNIPGRSFFAVLEGSPLAQGEHVLVYAQTGRAVGGVLIPSDAIVLSEDKAWCYAFEAPQTFRRVEINLNRTLTGGYFVDRGVKPDQFIVIRGTGLLLARELGAATPGQD